MPVASRQIFSGIVAACLIAATLDISGACISSWLRAGTLPSTVLKYVAGGAVGLEKSMSNDDMMWLGLAIHYFIASCWTTLYCLLFPAVPFLSQNKFIAGLAFGATIWCVMNLIVLPLTPLPHFPMSLRGIATGMGILIVAIGLPVAYMAPRIYRNPA